jgi:hypothetical protein
MGNQKIKRAEGYDLSFCFKGRSIIKNRPFVIPIAISVIAFSCGKGKNDTTYFNVESTRRDVKICVDPSANLIDLNPILIDVAAFGQLSVPEVHKEDARQEAEQKVYTITATLEKVKKIQRR